MKFCRPAALIASTPSAVIEMPRRPPLDQGLDQTPAHQSGSARDEYLHY